MTLGTTAKEKCVKDLKAFLASAEGQAAKPEAVVAYLRDMQVNSNLMLKECPYIYVSAVIDEEVLKAGQIKQATPVLSALVATDANNFMTRHLIGALEEAFGGRLVSLLKAFPVVLKQVQLIREEKGSSWRRRRQAAGGMRPERCATFAFMCFSLFFCHALHPALLSHIVLRCVLFYLLFSSFAAL